MAPYNGGTKVSERFAPVDRTGSNADLAWYRTAADRAGSASYACSHDNYPSRNRVPEYGSSGDVGSASFGLANGDPHIINQEDSQRRGTVQRSDGGSQSSSGGPDDDIGPPVHISASQFHQLARQTLLLEQRYEHLIDRNKLLGDRVMRMRNNFKNAAKFSKNDKALTQRAFNAWIALVHDFRIENNIDKQTLALAECQDVAKELGDGLTKERELRASLDQAMQVTQAEFHNVQKTFGQAHKAIEDQSSKMKKLQLRLQVAEEIINLSKYEARQTTETLDNYDPAKAKKEAERRILQGGKGLDDEPDLGHDRVERSNSVRQAAHEVAASAKELLPFTIEKHDQQSQMMKHTRSTVSTAAPLSPNAPSIRPGSPDRWRPSELSVQSDWEPARAELPQASRQVSREVSADVPVTKTISVGEPARRHQFFNAGSPTNLPQFYPQGTPPLSPMSPMSSFNTGHARTTPGTSSLNTFCRPAPRMVVAPDSPHVLVPHSIPSPVAAAFPPAFCFRPATQADLAPVQQSPMASMRSIGGNRWSVESR